MSAPAPARSPSRWRSKPTLTFSPPIFRPPRCASPNPTRSNSRRESAFSPAIFVDAFRDHSIDVLVSNPPYVPQTDNPSLQREVRDYEPHVALFGGPTGLEIYQRLIAEAARVLRPWRWLLLELGYNSLDPVRAMLEHGWSDIDVIPDLAGFPRVLAAQLLQVCQQRLRFYMIPTAHKSKIPKTISYPVGAKAISDALIGVPQCELLKLDFVFQNRSVKDRKADAPYTVLTASYRGPMRLFSASKAMDELSNAEWTD